MPILFIIFLTSAFADTFELRGLREKTYTRDNSYCKMGSKRIEIQIRSESKMTERGDKKYGDYIFYYPKVLGKLAPLGHDKLNSYRFFTGKHSLCSKSLGFALDKNKIAVLFLKENRPFMDKLSFQIFDGQNIEPLEVVETEYSTDKAEKTSTGFMFRTHPERLGLDMGKTKIEGLDYVFQDRDFPIWVEYSLKGFEINPEASFKKFGLKKYFKDQKDFLETTAWDGTEKKFKNSVLYVAFNHKKKKRCLFFSPTKVSIKGSEAWRCL